MTTNNSEKINFNKQINKEVEEFEKKNGKCVYTKKANLPKLPKGWK